MGRRSRTKRGSRVGQDEVEIGQVAGRGRRVISVQRRMLLILSVAGILCIGAKTPEM